MNDIAECGDHRSKKNNSCLSESAAISIWINTSIWFADNDELLYHMLLYVSYVSYATVCIICIICYCMYQKLKSILIYDHLFIAHSDKDKLKNDIFLSFCGECTTPKYFNFGIFLVITNLIQIPRRLPSKSQNITILIPEDHHPNLKRSPSKSQKIRAEILK